MVRIVNGVQFRFRCRFEVGLADLSLLLCVYTFLSPMSQLCQRPHKERSFPQNNVFQQSNFHLCHPQPSPHETVSFRKVKTEDNLIFSPEISFNEKQTNIMSKT